MAPGRGHVGAAALEAELVAEGAARASQPLPPVGKEMTVPPSLRGAPGLSEADLAQLFPPGAPRRISLSLDG